MTDTAAPATDELPADGPWSKAWNVVSETAGNVEKGVSDAFSNAKQAVDTFKLPWERDGADLATQTKNDFPPIDTTAYAAQQAKPSVGFSDLLNRLVGVESGGKQTDASGNILTSPKGAKGITQVMPKTGDNPGYGVTPLQDQTPQEYLRFGGDYLKAMIKNFGGDQTKAVAAYNAGPGAVDRAVAKAQKTGGDWTSYVPVETQKYIKKIIGV